MTPTVAVCEAFDAEYTPWRATRILVIIMWSWSLILVDRKFLGNTGNDVEEILK
jgi:hypothetical protein